MLRKDRTVPTSAASQHLGRNLRLQVQAGDGVAPNEETKNQEEHHVNEQRQEGQPIGLAEQRRALQIAQLVSKKLGRTVMSRRIPVARTGSVFITVASLPPIASLPELSRLAEAGLRPQAASGSLGFASLVVPPAWIPAFLLLLLSHI